jgi:GNAT superfamily N-acetyltransferase
MAGRPAARSRQPSNKSANVATTVSAGPFGLPYVPLHPDRSVVYVLPNFRRTEVASKLMSQLLDWGRQAGGDCFVLNAALGIRRDRSIRNLSFLMPL